MDKKRMRFKLVGKTSSDVRGDNDCVYQWQVDKVPLLVSGGGGGSSRSQPSKLVMGGLSAAVVAIVVCAGFIGYSAYNSVTSGKETVEEAIQRAIQEFKEEGQKEAIEAAAEALSESKTDTQEIENVAVALSGAAAVGGSKAAKVEKKPNRSPKFTVQQNASSQPQQQTNPGTMAEPQVNPPMPDPTLFSSLLQMELDDLRFGNLFDSSPSSVQP